LDESYRGKGLGKWILKNGITTLRKNRPHLEIIGFVKFENIASAVTFRNLGFREFVAKEIKNSYKYVY
jgi:L-amino acid N-acyltransferase YncA